MTNLQNFDMNVYKQIAERLITERDEARNKPAEPIVTTQAKQVPIITRDDNPAQISSTFGWLYVPSIGMEFSPDVGGLGLNWYEAQKLVKSQDLIMPNIRETWELFFHAKANLDKPEFRKLYEYFIKRTPKKTSHGEWQDAYFKEENGKMLMYRLGSFYDRRGHEEVLLTSEVDITQEYLMKGRHAKISKRKNMTSEGLCEVLDFREDYIEGENIHFWKPANNYVAGFVTDCDWFYLDCYKTPDFTDDSLGVRFARRVAPDITKILGAKQ